MQCCRGWFQQCAGATTSSFKDSRNRACSFVGIGSSNALQRRQVAAGLAHAGVEPAVACGFALRGLGSAMAPWTPAADLATALPGWRRHRVAANNQWWPHCFEETLVCAKPGRPSVIIGVHPVSNRQCVGIRKGGHQTFIGVHTFLVGIALASGGVDTNKLLVSTPPDPNAVPV